VQTALLEAAATSRSPAVAESLLKRWGTLTPTSQKGAISLLLRREPWTKSLLAGIESGTINAKDLLPQQWQTLTTHPDRDLAEKAKALQNASGRGISPDRKAIVEKFLPLAQQAGDAAKGRLVYEKNCLVCHTMEGGGGKVGPELTGIGAKPKADNLTDILDPNRAVEGTYRQWTARTEDDVIAGRLLTESKTSVEIIDPAGQVHVLQRDQLKSLSASDKSVMPEGFEQLPPEDLANLLDYLATSKVKH
jgi:putative heme-binding domain-containing protein